MDPVKIHHIRSITATSRTWDIYIAGVYSQRLTSTQALAWLCARVCTAIEPQRLVVGGYLATVYGDQGELVSVALVPVRE